MDEYSRIEKHYTEKFLVENYWNDFNKYPFYLSQTAYKYLVEILKDHKDIYFLMKYQMNHL